MNYRSNTTGVRIMNTAEIAMMSEDEFEDLFADGDLDDEYAEYIMEHGSIGNGEMLIHAMESHDFYEDFKEHTLYKYNSMV